MDSRLFFRETERANLWTVLIPIFPSFFLGTCNDILTIANEITMPSYAFFLTTFVLTMHSNVS
jgi:hypothetical protein